MIIIYLNFVNFLKVSEVIYVITSIVRDACGKAPSERLFLDKYGKICLCLDEIVWKVSFFEKYNKIYVVWLCYDVF